ncbi:uncharacterized protein [Musca autumnalis]|uniref:uncharacterized protein n=1 Tax=Musca autumnalis TaxID=221902 RepID=UPI003CF2B575
MFSAPNLSQKKTKVSEKMNKMAINWSRDTVERLIICVQQHPCLYNVRSPEYVDRIKKAHTWTQIVDELLALDSCLNAEEVKRKWRNLRVQFMHEERLVAMSKKSGAGAGDIYIPRLWCYSQMCFLKNYTEMRTSKDNVTNTESTMSQNITTDYEEDLNNNQEIHKQEPKTTIPQIIKIDLDH